MQIVLADHNDHLMVARILLNCDTTKLALGLTIPQLAVINHNFTEPDQEFDSYLYDPPPPLIPLIAAGGSGPQSNGTTTGADGGSGGNNTSTDITEVPLIITEDNATPLPGPAMPIAHVIKSLLLFLSQESVQPLWNYEDITAKGILLIFFVNTFILSIL